VVSLTFSAFPYRIGLFGGRKTARWLLSKTSRDGERFEKKLSDLEAIVSRLEAGDAPLEESLALFEKGTVLLKELNGILEDAERKVEILSEDASGVIGKEPFEEDDQQ
jgi:exodeoxyribonuclease VII small subunit